MLCKIDVDPWKPKVERFISARLVVAGKRPIAERDPGSQFTACSFQVKLVPCHCSIRICLRVIWAGDADSIGHDGKRVMRRVAGTIANRIPKCKDEKLDRPVYVCLARTACACCRPRSVNSSSPNCYFAVIRL